MPPTDTVVADTAPASPPEVGLEHKAFSAAAEAPAAAPVVLATEDETGVVEALVSVTGVRDDVDDIIEPGTYADTLARRRPKGVWSHETKTWTARTEAIEEWMPGDPRLPETARGGAPWPAAAGALYVKARFNLRADDGRNAYENVKFFSETGECEWSIGYVVPAGGAVKRKDGVRIIRKLDLYEYSPVLFGAAPLSSTLSVKSLTEAIGTAERVERADAEDPPDPLKALEDQLADEYALTADATRELEQAAAGEVKRAPSSARREELAKTGHAMEDGSYPVENEADLKRAIRAYGRGLGDGDADRRRKRAIQRHIIARARALNLGNLIPIQWWAEVGEAKTGLDPAAHPRGEDGQFTDRPGTDPADVVPDGDPRAESGTPDEHVDWAALDAAADAVPEGDVLSAEAQTKGSRASLDRSPGKNWVESTGELPGYIREVARAVSDRRGVPLDRAIPIAIATIRRWATGGGDVTAETRVKAAAALAAWEALKAKARGMSGKALEEDTEAAGQPAADRYDPTLEVGPDAGHLPPPAQTKTGPAPTLDASYEELLEDLRDALTAQLGGPDGDQPGWDHVELNATYPGRAIATRHRLSGDNAHESFEVTWAAEDGRAVTTGEPRPVRLTVEDLDGQDGPAGPLPAMVEDVSTAVKTLLAGTETKAGRVLSGGNEKRLRAAMEHLIAVLAAAGVRLDAQVRVPQTEAPDPAPPAAEPAEVKAEEMLDPQDYVRSLRVWGAAHGVEDQP